MIRVLVVDDHAVVRDGLELLLERFEPVTCVGTAADGAEAVARTAALAPDVVLMDLSMPVLDGIEATRAILAARPDTRIVALTSFADRDRVNEVLGAGAIGYLLKDSEPDAVVAAVRAAAAGQVPLDPRVAGILLPRALSDPAAALSGREREVLTLVARGLANKQIGRQLGISERTVKAHLGSVFRQLGVGDRTSAALWAKDHLPPPIADSTI